MAGPFPLSFVARREMTAQAFVRAAILHLQRPPTRGTS